MVPRQFQSLESACIVMQSGVHSMFGEFGPGAKQIAQEWATDMQDRRLRARVSFFFKQWGTFKRREAGRQNP